MKWDTVTEYMNHLDSMKLYGIPYFSNAGTQGQWLGFSRRQQTVLEELRSLFMIGEGLDRQYDNERMALAGASQTRYVEPTFREKIQSEITELEAQVTRRKEMLQLLDENPAIDKFMTLSRGR